MDLPRFLDSSVRAAPRSLALDDGRRQLTYALLKERAARLANALRGQGLGSGAHVGVLLGNRVEHIEVDWALALGGMVRVALKSTLLPSELRGIAEQCGLRALVTDVSPDQWLDEQDVLSRHVKLIYVGSGGPTRGPLQYESLLENASGVPPALADLSSAPAWIYYTSGTTANPKGVVLSHEAIVRALQGLITTVPFTKSSHLYVPLPLSQANGYYALACLGVGGEVAIDTVFDPDRLSLAASGGMNAVHLTARQVEAVLSLESLGGIETLVYGSAPVRRELLEALVSKFGQVFTQIYGQSEAPVSITHLGRNEHRVGTPELVSVGQPFPGVEIKVVGDEGATMPTRDVGELFAKGCPLIDRYVSGENVPVRDGWLQTGDLAYRDEHGFVYLRGRLQDMIVCGDRIPVRDVEDSVCELSWVEECAALSKPDPAEGLDLYVVRKPTGSMPDSEMKSQCAARVPDSCNVTVQFLKELPKTDSGKLLRRKLIQ